MLLSLLIFLPALFIGTDPVYRARLKYGEAWPAYLNAEALSWQFFAALAAAGLLRSGCGMLLGGERKFTALHAALLTALCACLWLRNRSLHQSPSHERQK